MTNPFDISGLFSDIPSEPLVDLQELEYPVERIGPPRHYGQQDFLLRHIAGEQLNPLLTEVLTLLVKRKAEVTAEVLKHQLQWEWSTSFSWHVDQVNRLVKGLLETECQAIELAAELRSGPDDTAYDTNTWAAWDIEEMSHQYIFFKREDRLNSLEAYRTNITPQGVSTGYGKVEASFRVNLLFDEMVFILCEDRGTSRRFHLFHFAPTDADGLETDEGEVLKLARLESSGGFDADAVRVIGEILKRG